jgi:hypothetical protein
MLVIGCLLPVLLLAAGGGAGLAIGGTVAGLWGAAAGFVIGCVALIVLLWGFELAKDR